MNPTLRMTILFLALPVSLSCASSAGDLYHTSSQSFSSMEPVSPQGNKVHPFDPKRTSLRSDFSNISFQEESSFTLRDSLGTVVIRPLRKSNAHAFIKRSSWGDEFLSEKIIIKNEKNPTIGKVFRHLRHPENSSLFLEHFPKGCTVESYVYLSGIDDTPQPEHYWKLTNPKTNNQFIVKYSIYELPTKQRILHPEQVYLLTKGNNGILIFWTRDQAHTTTRKLYSPDCYVYPAMLKLLTGEYSGKTLVSIIEDFYARKLIEKGCHNRIGSMCQLYCRHIIQAVKKKNPWAEKEIEGIQAEYKDALPSLQAMKKREKKQSHCIIL